MGTPPGGGAAAGHHRHLLVYVHVTRRPPVHGRQQIPRPPHPAGWRSQARFLAPPGPAVRGHASHTAMARATGGDGAVGSGADVVLLPGPTWISAGCRRRPTGRRWAGFSLSLRPVPRGRQCAGCVLPGAVLGCPAPKAKARWPPGLLEATAPGLPDYQGKAVTSRTGPSGGGGGYGRCAAGAGASSCPSCRSPRPSWPSPSAG